jgi:hypothetical protein
VTRTERAARIKARACTRNRRMVLGLILASAFTLGAMPVASASAMLSMRPFAAGPVTNQKTPTFTGNSEDGLDPVTVNIFKGETATGQPLQSLSALPLGPTGSWSVAPAEPLEDGIYTVVAEQSESGGLGPAMTPPYTFTVGGSVSTVNV